MVRRHRSALKQQNKAFKGSASNPKSLKEKRRSAAAAAAALAVNRKLSKAERQQHSKQRRLQQRRDLKQQRTATAAGPAPKVVLLLPFSDAVCIDKAFSALTKELLQEDGDDAFQGAELCMEEDGMTPGTTAVTDDSSHSLSQTQRYLFSLPSYAWNPAIPKKYPQQLVVLPAPCINATKDKLDSTLQLERKHPQRHSELLRFMDLCSSCDVLVCLFGGTCTYNKSAFSTRGYQVLQALKLQGLPPSVLGVGCTDMAILEPGHSLQGKAAAAESLKFMRRFFESELGADRKFFGIGGAADWCPVIRALGAAAAVEVKKLAKVAEAAAWRRRGHLIGLDWRIAPLQVSDDPQAPPEPCLEVIGLVRGAGLTCKLPVHVTGVGNFVVSRIEVVKPHHEQKRREPAVSSGQATADAESLGEALERVVEASNPLQPLDVAALEQTWPTREELMEDGPVGSRARSKCVRIPKDVGDYERAWLESDTEGEQSQSGDEHPMNSDVEMQTEEMPADASNEFSHAKASEGAEDDWKPLDDVEQQRMQADNEAYAAQRHEAAEMEKEFPDQMETPLDIPAKERFQKYRGLKSFRSSPWAKNEDLPFGYGRIVDVSSIKGLAGYAHRTHAELCRETQGFSGRVCRLLLPLRHSYALRQLVLQQPPLERGALDEALANTMAQRLAGRFRVPSDATQDTTVTAPLASRGDDPMQPDFLLVSQLLQHESQVTVVHSQVTFCSQEPIKGKDPVLMACGFRRFPAAPIYSEEPRQGVRSAAKWKFKRWAEPGTTLTATVYAPLVLPPSPCIMLRSDSSVPGDMSVTAWGSVLPVNGASSRLIIKRVLLSGHPFKVHRRKAVVRFMFFNPGDVRWFSPIELHTKRGLRGNIVEPLGTHGYMKCKFSDYLKQNDEVLLPLYRRVFPKWYPSSWGGLPNQQPMD